MLDNRDLKKVFKKAEELKEFNTKKFGDLTVSELNHYFNKAEVLIDYIFCFKEGLEIQKEEQ